MQLLMYSPKQITITREIAYQQSICECCGQYEYDEHEGILFMKKTIVGELFLYFFRCLWPLLLGCLQPFIQVLVTGANLL